MLSSGYIWDPVSNHLTKDLKKQTKALLRSKLPFVRKMKKFLWNQTLMSGHVPCLRSEFIPIFLTHVPAGQKIWYPIGHPWDVTARTSHSWTDAKKQISWRQAWRKGSQEWPVFSTTMDVLLSQQNLMWNPFHPFPQSLKVIINVKSSKAFMWRFCSVMKDGKMEWKYWPLRQPQ